MCLIVKQGCKTEIAQKDIVCYKFVEGHGKYWKPCILGIFGNNAGYSYPYNKVLTAESYNYGEKYSIQQLEIRCREGLYLIGEGFHARLNKTHYWMNICVIPKGTEYCLGRNNEIVAVNMIVFRSMLGYYWYRIKKLWREYIQTVK